MVNNVIVMERVHLCHPDIDQHDVIKAWDNIQKSMRRNVKPYNYVAVGIDGKGRQLEMLAFLDENSDWIVYHAMRATRKVLRELGVLGR